MNRDGVKRIAADKLGAWRFTVGSELRALPELLAAEERVSSMAVGSLGGLRGRLIVVTDRRLLLIHRWWLRPARVEEFGYEELESVRVCEQPRSGKLLLVASETGLSLEVGARAAELADQIKQAAGGGKVSTEPGISEIAETAG